MSTVVATRFSDDLLAALDEVARELHRSRAEVVRRAVEVFVNEHADYQIALERLNDPTDVPISTEDMWRALGWSDDLRADEADDATT